MIPRLQRFYGGDPAAWLDCPFALLRAYADQLPKLAAQDQLSQIASVSVGTNNAKKAQSRRIQRNLQKEARRGQRAKPVSRATLAAYGIQFEEVAVNERQPG